MSTASMLECPDLANTADPRFYNDDIAPTPVTRRTWDKWHIAALWVGMSVCVPTYMLASSLVQSGMDWKQAIGTVFLANLLVLIPMILNAHAGTKFGIPFPVYCRVAFGLVGANVPALMRGLVACGWFGIQTWIGGSAMFTMLAAQFPAVNNVANLPLIGENPWKFFCFLLFWAINMAIVWRGIDSIQFLEKWGAPFLILIGFALLLWAYITADGFGPMLSEPSKLTTWPEFMAVFAPGLT
ncbi:MAG: cytosine permease, partial [Candidatus Eremiobacteraeota bacterium]|nr:cytosine permease [Candidatus Eremiobacteraeota bacterium]